MRVKFRMGAEELIELGRPIAIRSSSRVGPALVELGSSGYVRSTGSSPYLAGKKRLGQAPPGVSWTGLGIAAFAYGVALISK